MNYGDLHVARVFGIQRLISHRDSINVSRRITRTPCSIHEADDRCVGFLQLSVNYTFPVWKIGQ